MFEPKGHPMSRWLFGTTCSNYRIKLSVLFENDTHIVLKHNSHSTYVDRSIGTMNCGVYAKLYLKETFFTIWNIEQIGYGEIMKWEGRQNVKKDKILNDCKNIGIIF